MVRVSKKKKKKKKKREYPLHLYRVEFEYTTQGETFVRAESEGHARQIAEDNEIECLDRVAVEQIEEDDLPDGESILNENGNYE